MGKNYLIGVDIGTGGTKAGLFSEEGECVAEAFEVSDLHRPAAGTVEEDPERQAASVARTIRECVERSGVDASSVCGIAIDGQMAGIIGVGADGRNVTPYDSWLDTRCAPYIDRMNQTAGDAVLASTGNTPSFNHGPKILWWKEEHPEVYARIHSFVQPGGYAAMRLCGLSADHAFIDTTYLHFSGFADSEHAKWNRELLATFDVDAGKLPQIRSPQEVVGALSSEFASACGLREGTPVAAGAGDTAASFLSCGAVDEGVCVDVAGTASVFAATVRQFRVDRADMIMGIGRSIVPGLWHPYAYINGGGLNLSWFRDEIVMRR
ncbi:xylulokinase [Salinispira pacifica]